jgi:hypothetical protein
LSKSRLLAVAFSVWLVACSSEQLGYVDKKNYEDSQRKIAALQKDLAAAQKEVADLKAHQYQFMLVGYRTWRFDTVTGGSCIQLTSESDWKRKETKRQSCDCTDLFTDAEHPPDKALTQMYCGF